MTLLAKMIRRGPAGLLWATEALVLLAFFRICLAIIPSRRIIAAVTHGKADLPSTDLNQADAGEREMNVARRVQWAVRAVARHSAIKFVCFPQSLAAFTMLRWRHVPSIFVYGVGRSPEGKLVAHTWVEMGGGYVVG